MAKKLVSLLLALTLAVVCGAALAETTTTGVAYGVYSNEGEHPDSLIRVTLTLDNGRHNRRGAGREADPRGHGRARPAGLSSPTRRRRCWATRSSKPTTRSTPRSSPG